MDYCTAGPQYASGGYLADSRASFVINGSQQQWLTRNSEVGGWSNGVWNQVFAGTVGAPSEAGFPTPPYTTLDETPVSREKPFLHVGDDGAWRVRVPDAQTDSRGISWADGPTAGRDLPLSSFHVADPRQPASVLAKALDRGKNLLLTPGVYDIDRSLVVSGDDAVVLGLGQATLTASAARRPSWYATRPRASSSPASPSTPAPSSRAPWSTSRASPATSRSRAPPRPARPSTTSTSASAVPTSAVPTPRCASTPTTC